MEPETGLFKDDNSLWRALIHFVCWFSRVCGLDTEVSELHECRATLVARARFKIAFEATDSRAMDG